MSGEHASLPLLLVGLPVAGCTATPGTSRFDTLAEMGLACADGRPGLIAESFDVSMIVDSEI